MAQRHVNIGSGIAGLCAAETLCDCRPEDEVTLIREEPHKYYSRPGLAYLLRGDVPERQLHIRTPDDLRAQKFQRVNARVEMLHCDQRELKLSDSRTVNYDRLLLATGALAVPPPFPGKELAGLVKLDSLDDTLNILKSARPRRAAGTHGPFQHRVLSLSLDLRLAGQRQDTRSLRPRLHRLQADG
jgi:NAD(P)H-nitrite reductase large subunit